jgi:6-phosphogluconolactonase
MTGEVSSGIRVYPSPSALTEAAADTIMKWAAGAVRDHGRFAIALSGGRTPKRLYQMLAEAGPDAFSYDRLEVFWSDERAVPPDHPESNYRLAWETWLSRVPLDPQRVHRIRGEDDPEAAAARYEEDLRTALGDPPRLDLILLGIAQDGHTASLFPGAPALASERWVVAARATVPPHHRVTFTPRLIRPANRVMVLATGKEKARAVRAALQDPPSEAVPASLLRGKHIVWYLDRPAAAGLTGKPVAPLRSA